MYKSIILKNFTTVAKLLSLLNAVNMLKHFVVGNDCFTKDSTFLAIN